MIEAGGDVVVGEAPPGQAGWSVFVAGADTATLQRAKAMVNSAIATSGGSEQFVEIDGVRYSHVIDRRTGLGVTGTHLVTVIADDGALADALATALSVLVLRIGWSSQAVSPRSCISFRQAPTAGQGTGERLKHGGTGGDGGSQWPTLSRRKPDPIPTTSAVQLSCFEFGNPHYESSCLTGFPCDPCVPCGQGFSGAVKKRGVLWKRSHGARGLNEEPSRRRVAVRPNLPRSSLGAR